MALYSETTCGMWACCVAKWVAVKDLGLFHHDFLQNRETDTMEPFQGLQPQNPDTKS